MEVKKQFEEDGYLITYYDNGTITKNLISDIEIDSNPELNLIKEENNNTQITMQDQANAEILNKLDYLTCLQEINSMKGGN
ncbi:hypothetical protein [[Clostridium] colinum]|uniref:hypothetical protein n=1 Tax=[Clostridium] colinum TaxID=36835 RepID=UPI0020241488|nr:hypothetical protein [[Clostridium] colinum]